MAAVNVAGLFGAELGGLVGAIQRFGPPLVTSVAVALREWIAPSEIPGNALTLALRQILWMLASAALLVRGFARIEIR
jgi:hypothetical protein